MKRNLNIPDISGFTLGDAKIILANAVVKIIEIEITSPPKHRTEEYEDSFRVVRVQQVDERSVKLLICKPL